MARDNICVCTAVLMLAVAITDCAPRSRCIVEGDMRVPVGYRWRSAAGCGWCECKPRGIISCPDNRACEDESNVMECQYEGRYIRLGEEINHTDGCNRCTCQHGGQVTCTSNVCHCPHLGKLLDIGTVVRANDTCNTCQCTTEGTLLCTSNTCEPEVCVFRNISYTRGEQFPRGDSCNNCTCGAERRITCTEARCVETKCTQDGVMYQVGDVFPKGDGCNTCNCDADGEIMCSTKVCPSPSTTVTTAVTTTVTSDGTDSKNKSCQHEEKLYTVGQKFTSTLTGDVSKCKSCTCMINRSQNEQAVSWDCTEIMCSQADTNSESDDPTRPGGGERNPGLDKGWRSLTIASLVTWLSSWFQ